MKSVLVVDYGMGNIFSVRGALARAGGRPTVSAEPKDIQAAERIVLPGVGAFPRGIRNLTERGLVEPLLEAARKGTPLLGICLGAQLLARRSEEGGEHEGLGIIEANVVRLNPSGGLRLPHIGWNEVVLLREDPLFSGIGSGALFYFVHSYHLRCDRRDAVSAEAEYGGAVTAAARRDNVWAVQFHPEKSQAAGIALLENFLRQ